MGRSFAYPRPNLFIVGAPKCGTTSLYRYLGEHPNVYFPSVKEPHFFAGEFVDPHRGADYRERLEGYLDLFRSAPRGAAYLGDASVWYLYARGSFERILRFNSDAKFLALVRNPIEMAPSLHQQLLNTSHEWIESFDEAWKRRAANANEDVAVHGVRPIDPRGLVYREVCALGRQVERLFRIVPESQRMVIELEELKLDPADVYRRVLGFLELEHDGRVEFPVLNERRRVVVPALAAWNRRLPRWDWWIRVKRAIGLPRFSVLQVPAWVYTRPGTSSKIDKATMRDLVETFRPDVEKLSRVLGRDLTHWLDRAPLR